MRWKLILILALLMLLVIFTLQNYEVVTIQFLFWSFRTSRTIIIFATFLIGVLAGLIVSFMRRR